MEQLDQVTEGSETASHHDGLFDIGVDGIPIRTEHVDGDLNACRVRAALLAGFNSNTKSRLVSQSNSKPFQAPDTELSQELEILKLMNRVQDWKGHQISQLGRLIKIDYLDIIVVGEKTCTRRYHVYLFEHILLCFKPVNLGSRRQGSIQQVNFDGLGDWKLKGRVFLRNITNVGPVTTVRGYGTLPIFWKNGEAREDGLFILIAELGVAGHWVESIDQQIQRLKN